MKNTIKIQFENLKKLNEKCFKNYENDKINISLIEKKNKIENDILSLENDEILRKYCNEIFNKSEKLLNLGFDYNEMFEIHENEIDEYFEKYGKDYIYFKKTTKFYYDELTNIENVLIELTNILLDNITYKKHLDILNEIEIFLNTGFIENIINGFGFYYINNNEFQKYNYNIIDLSEYINDENENEFGKNTEFDFKIMKKSLRKIINLICKILKENIVEIEWILY